MYAKRNDRWLNTHVEPCLQSWMANMDMRLVCDIGKVVEYLTKYITKTEKSMSKGLQTFLLRFLRKHLDQGNDVISTLRRMMSMLMGSRVISKQETCHLINSLPLVSCSHNFLHMNLDQNTFCLDFGTNDDERTNVISCKNILELYSKELI